MILRMYENTIFQERRRAARSQSSSKLPYTRQPYSQSGPSVLFTTFSWPKLRVADSLVKRNVTRKLTFLHNTVTWRHWIAPRPKIGRFCAVNETASNISGLVTIKDKDTEESDYVLIVFFFSRRQKLIYVIGSCRQVCSVFLLKVVVLFDHWNRDKKNSIKNKQPLVFNWVFILISVLQIFDFQCIKLSLTYKNQSLLPGEGNLGRYWPMFLSSGLAVCYWTRM